MGSRTLARYFAGRFFVSVAAVFAGVFVLVLFVDYIDLMRRASDAPKAQASMLVLVSLFRVPQIMERLRVNWAFLRTEARAASCCELLDMEGGWYAVLRTKRDEPDEDLAIKILREAGVLIHPGHFYDFPAHGCMVLSLITPVEALRCGVHKLLEYLQ